MYISQPYYLHRYIEKKHHNRTIDGWIVNRRFGKKKQQSKSYKIIQTHNYMSVYYFLPRCRVTRLSCTHILNSLCTND